MVDIPGLLTGPIGQTGPLPALLTILRQTTHAFRAEIHLLTASLQLVDELVSISGSNVFAHASNELDVVHFNARGRRIGTVHSCSAQDRVNSASFLPCQSSYL